VPHEKRINLGLAVPVDGQRRVADVLTALSDVMTRFETLRTTFRVGVDGEPTQVVSGAGTLPVEMCDAGDEPAEAVASALAESLASHRFDLEAGPLLRWGIVMVGDHPRAVAVGMSNMVVDGWGLRLLRHQLWSRLSDQVDGGWKPTGQVGETWQPLDQARYEQSTPGRELARGGFEYWREQLSAIRAIPPPNWRPVGETPRYWCAEFVSTALAQATHQVAARLRVPPSAALLAGFAAVLGARTGQRALGLAVVVNNRFTRRATNSLGKFFQSAPICLDLDVDSLEELVQRTARDLLRAARHGRSDPLAVARLVHTDGPHRGAHLALPVIYDFHGVPDLTVRPEPVSPEALARLAVGSKLQWVDAVEQENMRLFTQVRRLSDEARVTMWLDTHFLSRADLAALVVDVERLLVTLVHGDVPTTELMAAMRVATAASAP